MPPSSDQLAFWSAIRANPDDDTPRLVYADWLQENGDEERAEFIRLQIELERLGPDPRPVDGEQARDLADFRRKLASLPPEERPRALAEQKQAMDRAQTERKQALERAHDWFAKRKPLLEREKELFDRNWQRWIEPLRGGLEQHAERGLLEIECDREIEYDQLPVGRLPPNRLDCRLKIGHKKAGWKQKWVIAFRRGFVTPLGLELREACWLVTADEHIEEPVVVRSIGGHVYEFNGSNEPEDDWRVTMIAGWVRGSCVTDLNLISASDRTVHALVSGGWFTGLVSARFACVERLVHSGQVTDDGAIELAASPMFGRLKALWLHGQRIGDRGAFALADSPHLAGLERLDLHGNPIGEAGRSRLRERFGDCVHFGPEEIA